MARTLGPDAFEKRTVFLHIQEGPAKFAIMAAFHLSAQLRTHGLLAIANAEDRNALVKDRLRRSRRPDIGRRMRTAGKDNTLRLQPFEGLFSRLKRNDFTIDIGFAHTTRNQLRDLA